MKSNSKLLAITSPSFCKNPDLVAEAKKLGVSLKLNEAATRFDDSTLEDFLRGATHAIVGTEKITRSLLSNLLSLKAISKYGVGLDNIDFQACADLGIQVAYSSGVNKRSVSELTLAFILGAFRNVFMTSKQLSGGIWNKNGGFQLTEKTVGIVGLGNIGQDLVHLLKPFKCRILYNDIADRSAFAKTHSLRSMPLLQLIQQSDVVTLHVPLTSKTRNLLSLSEMRAMKDGSLLINTARGGIVSEKELKSFLKERPLVTAAIDVFEEEPLCDVELQTLPNVVLTPHIGGNAREAVHAMGSAAIDNLKPFLVNEK